MENIRKTIGKRIYTLRRGKDLTQQALAELIGVNTSYIGPLEKGLKCPSIAVLEKLSEVFSQPVFSFSLEEPREQNSDNQVLHLQALLGKHTEAERQFLLKLTEEASRLLQGLPA